MTLTDLLCVCQNVVFHYCDLIYYNFLSLQLFGIKKIMIVYVESVCRVTTMSLSGKMLYHFADQIIVQWPELQKDYPLTRCFGRVV